MYRPKGWKTIPLWSRLRDGTPITSTHEAFEAGADAMLEVLLESDEPSCEVYETFVTGMNGKPVGPVRAYGKDFKGKLVFIPDETDQVDGAATP